MHNPDTEKEMSLLDANKRQKRPENSRPDIIQACDIIAKDLKDMLAASLIKSSHDKATEQKFAGIQDTRLISSRVKFGLLDGHQSRYQQQETPLLEGKTIRNPFRVDPNAHGWIQLSGADPNALGLIRISRVDSSVWGGSDCVGWILLPGVDSNVWGASECPGVDAIVWGVPKCRGFGTNVRVDSNA
jgi:hypothetical protein